jgi:SAM-dependent methyltransferase
MPTLEKSESKGQAFWTKRLQAHGHTGWADPVIYAYDQLERLALIDEAISNSPRGNGIALDFGCGVGDFSKLLLRHGFKVCGYDPFVQPKIDSESFTYANSYDAIPLGVNSATLAISITTLDHILDERELLHALATIHKHLNCAGVFYMLEYALDATSDRDRFGHKNNYQSLRTLSEWTRLLNQSAFRIKDVRPVPHPLLSPSLGYTEYVRSSIVRMRKRYGRLPIANYWLDYMLRRRAAKLIRQFPPTLNNSTLTPLKLFRCRVA